MASCFATTPSAYNDTSVYAARRDPRRGESPMMCASTVQVAALPGEVVSNTGKQNYCQRTEGRSRLGAYVCSSDLWERPSVSFDSRDMGIGHSLLSTSFSRYLKHPLSFHCPHTPPTPRLPDWFPYFCYQKQYRKARDHNGKY